MRVLLFIVFFSIGATVLTGAMLYDEMVVYYKNKQLLASGGQSLKKLESLSSDYDVLIEQLKQDPNLVKRAAAIALGTGQRDPNTVYPKAQAEVLQTARETLADDNTESQNQPQLPNWMIRCQDPNRRAALIAAASALIIVSFTFFGPRKTKTHKHTD